MAQAGFSVGTFTGGGTFLVESLSGTMTPVGVTAWGGAGTVNRVTPSAPLPIQVYGGTFNAGTVTATVSGTVVAAGTQVVSGTVVTAGTQTVAGTVNTGNAGTVAMLQAGTITTIANGTLTAIAAGTQVVSGTVTATAAGTQTVTHPQTVLHGTINLTSGSVALVAPGSGTAVAIVGYSFSAGTTGAVQFQQGAGASSLSGTMYVDQYGGFTRDGSPGAPVLKGAAGSTVYLTAVAGTPNVGGHFSYYLEA